MSKISINDEMGAATHPAVVQNIRNLAQGLRALASSTAQANSQSVSQSELEAINSALSELDAEVQQLLAATGQNYAAVVAINKYAPVYAVGNNTAGVASASSPTTLLSLVGIASGPAAIGAVVPLIEAGGTIQNSAWAWTAGEPVYVGTGGALTQVLPAVAAPWQIGVALTATIIFVDPLPVQGAENANTVYAGPVNGSAAEPSFRSIVPADLPLMGASGTSHQAGAVPDPGATAGATRYLREDATWDVPPGGSGGSAFDLSPIQQEWFAPGTAGSSFTITFPQTATSGNQLYVLMHLDAESAITFPSGWTTVFSQTQGSYSHIALITKTSNGTETGFSISEASGTTSPVFWFFELGSTHTIDQHATSGTAGNPANVQPPSFSPSASSNVFAFASFVMNGITSPSLTAMGWKNVLGYNGSVSTGRCLVGFMKESLAAGGTLLPPLVQINGPQYSGGTPGIALASFSIK